MLVLRMQLPDWSAALLVSVSVGLALVVLTAMLFSSGRRTGPRADKVDVDPASAQARPGLDVMLLVSTLAIVGLALAVYLTRP